MSATDPSGADPVAMQRTFELATYAVESGSGGPFGAVIVPTGQPGEIWAEGYNRVLADSDPTAHAELVAIRRACERLRHFSLTGFELYTSCEPCPMCWSAALWARVDRIVYAGTREDAADAGFDDGVFHRELALSPAERALSSVEFLRDGARAAFELWKTKADRTPY